MFDIKKGTPQSSRPPSNAGLNTSPIVTTSSQLPRKRSFSAHPNLSTPSINSPIALPACGGGVSGLNGSSTTHSLSPSPSSTMGIPSGLGLSSAVNVHIGTPLVEVDAEHETDDVYDDDSMDMGDSNGGTGLCTRSGSVSTSTGAENSSVEGSPTEEGQTTASSGSGMAASMGVIGKPMVTNNFVSKLYQ